MSKKAFSADNQQGSPVKWDPSETIRRAPLSKRVVESYLLGTLHDGTFSSNKRFRISQKGRKWLGFLRKLFNQLGYNAWIYKEGSNRKVYVLETLANFLDFKFNPLRLSRNEERIAYIRGFFDAEGGIPKNKNDRFYIQLVQNDKEKLLGIKKLLDNLGIQTGKIHNPSRKVDPGYWRMYVLANSQKRFVRQINSWHPKKIATLRKRMMI